MLLIRRASACFKRWDFGKQGKNGMNTRWGDEDSTEDAPCRLSLYISIAKKMFEFKRKKKLAHDIQNRYNRVGIGGVAMAQAMVNFRMDEALKDKMEKTCKNMGLTVTAAYTMFATKVTREQRIPFEVTADPFYSDENMDRLRKNMAEMEKTGGTVHEVNLGD